jgi:hypothetical protein
MPTSDQEQQQHDDDDNDDNDDAALRKETGQSDTVRDSYDMYENKEGDRSAMQNRSTVVVPEGDRSAMLLQGRRPALPWGQSDTVRDSYIRATLARLCPHAN